MAGRGKGGPVTTLSRWPAGNVAKPGHEAAQIEEAAMASTPAVYPSSHGVALKRVMRLIDLVAARPDIADEGVVAALAQSGVGEVDAELLVRFVSCACHWRLLKFMGLSRFPSTFQVRDDAGRWVEMPLAAEHYFRQLPENKLVSTRDSGFVPSDVSQTGCGWMRTSYLGRLSWRWSRHSMASKASLAIRTPFA